MAFTIANADDIEPGDVFRLSPNDTQNREALGVKDGPGTVTIEWRFQSHIGNTLRARKSTFGVNRWVYIRD